METLVNLIPAIVLIGAVALKGVALFYLVMWRTMKNRDPLVGSQDQ